MIFILPKIRDLAVFGVIKFVRRSASPYRMTRFRNGTTLEYRYSTQCRES